MSRRAWLTRDTLPGQASYEIRLPDDPGWRADFFGALVLLSDPNNWEISGALSPQEMSDFWSSLWWDQLPLKEGVNVVGEIRAYAGSGDLPAGWLPADGSSHDTEDYPLLFAVLGYAWGGSGSTFRVPDLRGRALVGSGQGSGLSSRTVGQVGGEEQHTLSVQEMPAHVHQQDFIMGTGSAVGEQVSGQPGADVGDISVKSEGGDQPHNNMQPFAVIQWIIRAIP